MRHKFTNNFSEVKVAKFVSTDKKENNVVSSQEHTYAKPVISHLDNYSKTLP